ncbi:MAG TPA: LapA family protein [Acidimicrobiales bacterium]|nr:LapA family protein [Acidimicrobiales bacterium]
MPSTQQQGGEQVTVWGPGSGRRLGAGAIASLSGLALLVIFMLQNRERVAFDFLWWSLTWPLWLIILVSAVVGAFVWFGLGVIRRHNRRKQRRADRRG